MQHGLRQSLRFRFQGCVELRKTLPLSDPIHRIDGLGAEHAGETGLHRGRKRLPLLRDFPQATAAGGFFLDKRGRRFARMRGRGRKGLAASFALERGIFRGGNPTL